MSSTSPGTHRAWTQRFDLFGCARCQTYSSNEEKISLVHHGPESTSCTVGHRPEWAGPRINSALS